MEGIRATKLQIINRLWGHVQDLLKYIGGDREKPLDEIEQELDVTEYFCRPYADCDDDELYAADVMRAARRILAERDTK